MDSILPILKLMDPADLFKVMKLALAEAEKRTKGSIRAATKKASSMPKGQVPTQLLKPRAWVDFTLKHALQNGWKEFTVHQKRKDKATGEVIEEIIDESYVITTKPEYDTMLYKQKTKENLVYGEHIDWIWINETWGGLKIGPNRPSYWGMQNPDGLTPIYLGITKNQISKLPFQFK
jgi:hypothetical protein